MTLPHDRVHSQSAPHFASLKHTIITVAMMLAVGIATTVGATVGLISWARPQRMPGPRTFAQGIEGSGDRPSLQISPTEGSGAAGRRTAALCMVVKDEEAYLDEFVEYHLALGFHKIYLHDNSDDFELEQWGAEAVTLSHRVNITHWPGEKVQHHVIHACSKRALDEGHTWVAVFDVDERLVLKEHDNVVSFLEDHCKEGAVSIQFANLGTGRREVFSPQPLLKRFKYRILPGAEEDRLVKTVTVLEHIEMKKTPTPHFFSLKKNYTRVLLLPWGNRIKDSQVGIAQEERSVLYNSPAASLYHPTYRSYKEYLFKRLYRGRATVSSSHWRHTNLIRQAKEKEVPPGTHWDDAGWRAMRMVLPKYRYYDELFPEQLQPLPSAPYVPGTRYRTAALCVPVKDEEAYVDEFVEYYTALGFNEIHMYDNSESFELEQWGKEKMLLGYPVNITHWPGDGAVNRVWKHCPKRALAAGHTWVANFDIDEFLVLKQHKNVLLFLEDYCKEGALSIHEVLMGTAGRRVYSPQPVTKRFRFRTDEYPSEASKSIAVLEHIDMTKRQSAHYPHLKEGYRRVTTGGQACDAASQNVDRSGSEEVRNTDVALLYHYRYKSYKEYQYKLLFRDGTVVNFTDLKWKRVDAAAKARTAPRGTRFDDTAWRAVKRHLPSYRYYEELFPDLSGHQATRVPAGEAFAP